MGPGLHSRIEAQKFSDLFPHIAFLDQPQGMGFAELVDWTCEAVKAQYALTQKPLVLLGHSFGGQLIAAALPRLGSMVKEVRLVNSAFDPFDCFANLQTHLAPEIAKGSGFWKDRTTDEKLGLIYSIAEHPKMAEAYWHNSTHQQSYQKLSQPHPALNIGSFVKVFTEFLNEKPHLKNAPWAGPVTIYYSVADNLIRNSATVEGWLQTFPGAKFLEVKNVGHYGLFESAELAAQFFVSDR